MQVNILLTSDKLELGINTSFKDLKVATWEMSEPQTYRL